jgi:hypothetical protein
MAPKERCHVWSGSCGFGGLNRNSEEGCVEQEANGGRVKVWMRARGGKTILGARQSRRTAYSPNLAGS